MTEFKEINRCMLDHMESEGGGGGGSWVMELSVDDNIDQY